MIAFLLCYNGLHKICIIPNNTWYNLILYYIALYYITYCYIISYYINYLNVPQYRGSTAYGTSSTSPLWPLNMGITAPITSHTTTVKVTTAPTTAERLGTTALITALTKKEKEVQCRNAWCCSVVVNAPVCLVIQSVRVQSQWGELFLARLLRDRSR